MRIEKTIGKIKGTITFDDYVCGRLHVQFDNVYSNRIAQIGYGIAPKIEHTIKDTSIQSDFENSITGILDGNAAGYAGNTTDIGSRYFGYSNHVRYSNLGSFGFIDGNSFTMQKNGVTHDTECPTKTEFDFYLGNKWKLTCIDNVYAIIKDMCDGKILNNGNPYTVSEINDFISNNLYSSYKPQGTYPAGSYIPYMDASIKNPGGSFFNNYEVKEQTYTDEEGNTKTKIVFNLDKLQSLTLKLTDTEKPSFLSYYANHGGLKWFAQYSGEKTGYSNPVSSEVFDDRVKIELNGNCYFMNLGTFGSGTRHINSLASVPITYKEYIKSQTKEVSVEYPDYHTRNFFYDFLPKQYEKCLPDDMRYIGYVEIDADENENYSLDYTTNAVYNANKISIVSYEPYVSYYSGYISDVPSEYKYVIDEIEKHIGHPITFLGHAEVELNASDKSIKKFNVYEWSDDEIKFEIRGIYNKIMPNDAYHKKMTVENGYYQYVDVNLANLIKDNRFSFAEVAEYSSFAAFLADVIKKNGLDYSAIKTSDITAYILFPVTKYDFENNKLTVKDTYTTVNDGGGWSFMLSYYPQDRVMLAIHTIDNMAGDYKYGADTAAFIDISKERKVVLPSPKDDATAFNAEYQKFLDGYEKLKQDFMNDFSSSSEMIISTGACAVRPTFLINNTCVFSFDDLFAYTPGGSNGSAFARYFSNVYQTDTHTYFDLVIENHIYGDVTLIDADNKPIEILSSEDAWKCYPHFSSRLPSTDRMLYKEFNGIHTSNMYMDYINTNGTITPVLDNSIGIDDPAPNGNISTVNNIGLGFGDTDSFIFNNLPLSDFSFPIARVYHCRIPRTGRIDESVVIASNKFYPDTIGLKSALYDVNFRYIINDNSEDRWVNENTYFYARQYADITICFKDNFGTRLNNIENFNFDLLEYYTDTHTNLSAIGEMPRKICKETKGIYAENLTFNEATGENEIRLIIPNHMTFDGTPCGFHDGELCVTYTIDKDFRKEWWIKFKNQDVTAKTGLHPNIIHGMMPYKDTPTAEDPVLRNTDSRVDYGNQYGIFPANFYYGNNFNYDKDYLFTNSSPLYDVSGTCLIPQDLSAYTFSGYNSYMSDTSKGNEGVHLSFETSDIGEKEIPILCSAFGEPFKGIYNVTEFVQHLIPDDMDPSDAAAGNFGYHTDNIYRNAVKFGAVVVAKPK